MANNPCFLFYVNDFEGGTRHMTDAELGCYLRVLMAQFNRGGFLPDDPAFLKRFSTSFDESWPIVKEKFVPIGDGKIQNKRLEDERIKRNNFVEKQRVNGNKGGRKKNPRVNPDINPKETHGHIKDKPVGLPLGIGKGIGNKEEGVGETMLCPEMVTAFKKFYPNYPDDPDADFPSCLDLAKKIARLYRWTIESIANDRKQDVLQVWHGIVAFSKKDPWYSTRSISDFNKEFQRLIQKMAAVQNEIPQKQQTVV